jgi:thiol-disulfide isomerase/thioredoxin
MIRRKVLVSAFAVICILFELKAQSSLEADSIRFWSSIKPISDSMGKAYSFWDITVKGQWQGINTDSLYNEYFGLRNQYYDRFSEFIMANPDNWTALDYFGSYVLNTTRVPLDRKRLMFSYFSENLRKSPGGLVIDSALERKANLSINSSAPVFSFKAVDGNSYSMSSFRGKPVLLCFWASWCGPCIKNIPMLKDIQAKYGGKLEMISVSIDRSEVKWKEALANYKMNWIQTCDLATYTNDTELRRIYDIHFIPEYILLDGEGRIVYQNFLLKDDSYEILKAKLNELR